MKEVYLVVPNIRSAHNVGAMFRTSDAFGIKKIFLCGYTATPPKKQIDKVALGAEKWIPWEHYDNPKVPIKNLKKEGVEIVGLEKTDSSQSVSEASFNYPIALVVGQEVSGMDMDLVEMCDKIIHIPMRGKKSSLNVSVAVGAALQSIINHN